jgi:ArsR family transcriptional regulator
MKDIELVERDQKLVDTFRALGHPARLKIMQVLAERGTCICSDVVDELPLAQSTVSQHLKVLKDAGLIAGRIEGLSVCYCIAPGAVERLAKSVTQFTIQLTPANACCDSDNACCTEPSACCSSGDACCN